MIIKDDTVLELFRDVLLCEWCGRQLPGGADPHHWRYKRGMGGGSRLDHPYNLVSMCRGFTNGGWKSCHEEAERHEITQAQLLNLVATRENVSPERIECELRRIRNLPKGSDWRSGS